MRLDIFESPTKLSLIQRYELKEGQKVNTMPPEGRIMLRYWALVPGKYDPAVCPFQEMASNFVEAAEEATKEVGRKGKMFLLKLKQPKANDFHSRKPTKS